MDKEIKGWDYIEPKCLDILKILKEHFPSVDPQSPESYQKIQYGIRLKNTEFGHIDITISPKNIKINAPMNSAKASQIKAKIRTLFSPSPQKIGKSEAEQIYEALKPYEFLPYLDFTLFYKSLQCEFEKYHKKLEIAPHLRNNFKELEKAYEQLGQERKGG